MNNKIRQSLPVYSWCALVFLSAIFSANAWAVEPVTASVRAAQETLDSTALRAIFTLRKRRWTSDGRPVQVYVLKDDNPLHKAFVREQLKMFPYQLRQQWNRVIFSGTGSAPQDFDNEADLLQAIAASTDAIGYSDDDSLPEGVAVIEINP